MMTKMATGIVVLGLGVAVLSGCGGDGDGGSDGGSDGDGGGGDGFQGQSADKIVSQSKSDMADLKTARVTGSLTSDGQQIDLDLQLSTEGDCTGTMGVSGGTTELLGTGGSVWMKPDEAFWKALAGASAQQIITSVGDKWVVVPADSEGLSEFCDLDELLDELMKDDDDTTYAKKGTDEVDGDEVLAIESTDEEGSSTGYVLADEPHYLVKVEKTEGDEPGSVTFSEFDESLDVEAPADDEILDLSSLTGG